MKKPNWISRVLKRLFGRREPGMSVEEMVEICKSFPEWMRKPIIVKPSTAVQPAGIAPLVDSLQNLIAQIKEVRKGALRVAILNTDFFPKTDAGEAAKKEITDYLKSITPESMPHTINPLMESSFSKLKMLGIDPCDAFKIIDGRSGSEAETASLLNTCEKLVSEIQKNISVSVGHDLGQRFIHGVWKPKDADPS